MRDDCIAEPRPVRRINWDLLLLAAKAERERTQVELCRVYLLNHLGIDDADVAADIVAIVNGVGR